MFIRDFAYVKFLTVSWSKKFSDDSKIWLKSYLGAGQFYGHTLHDRNIPHKIIYDYERETPNILESKKGSFFVQPTSTIRHLFRLTGFETTQSNAKRGNFLQHLYPLLVYLANSTSFILLVWESRFYLHPSKFHCPINPILISFYQL